MSNKAQIAIAIISLFVIATSGIYILVKNRPAVNPVGVAVSGSSQSSSSQLISSSSNSSILSSSSEVPKVVSSESVKVVEAPKIEVQQPKQETTIESPEHQNTTKIPCILPEYTSFSCYSFAYYPTQLGDNQLNNFDLGFLQENIDDIANYYYDSIKNSLVSNDYYIHSNGIQKLDNKNYLINFYFQDYSFKIGDSYEQLFPKTYKFTRINKHDGEFEQAPNYNFPTTIQYGQNINSVSSQINSLVEAETYTDKNNP
jgi:hypothetical protein